MAILLIILLAFILLPYEDPHRGDISIYYGTTGAFLGVLLGAPYLTLLNGPFGKGQTIGKRVMNIKVINENGDVPSYVQAFIRAIPLIIPYLGGIFVIIGAIAIYASDKNQRMGDMLAHTFVVTKDTEEVPKAPAPKESGFLIILIVLTLAIAIFTVLVIGVTLWYMGVFDIDETANTFTGFGAVKPIDFNFDAGDDKLDMSILNAQGQKIKMININCEGTDNPRTDEIDTGEHQTFTGIDCGVAANAGEWVTLDVSIEYTATGTGITHKSTGTLNSPAG